MPQPLSRPDAPALAQRGDYRVGVRTLPLVDASRQRPVHTELWYPARLEPQQTECCDYGPVAWYQLSQALRFPGQALRDAPFEPSPQPYPVLLYAHGAPGSRLQATYLCEHLASHGFVVAAVDSAQQTYGDFNEQSYVFGLLDRPADMSFVLDALQAMPELPIDAEQAGIMGYSFGGYTALAACGAGLDFAQLERLSERNDNIGYPLGFRDALQAKRDKSLGYQGDPRLRAALVFAPWNGPILDLTQISVPLFIAVGDEDKVAPYLRDARFIYEHAASQEVHLLRFALGSHNLFTDPCLPETRLVRDSWRHSGEPVWDKERSGDICKHASVAFFRQQLMADTPEHETADYLEQLNTLAGLHYERRGARD